MQLRPYTLFAIFLAAFSTSHAAPNDYPNRPVRIVVPFAPGGGGDYIVRAWSDKLSKVLNQSVIVDNRGGGNTVTGTEHVARSTPDGYTLLFTSTALTTNPTLIPNLRYRTPEDFTPIASVISYPFALAARSSLEFKNLKEIIEFAKKNPQKISISNAGEGSGSHLATELLKEATGASFLLVPYKGAGPAIADVAAGHVDLTFTGMSQVKPFVESQRVKVLASSGFNRLLSAPEVETVTEQGIPNFNSVVWWGMLAPAGTPKEIIKKVNSALKETLADPDVIKRLAVIDGEVKVSSPEEFEKMIREEVIRWGRVFN